MAIGFWKRDILRKSKAAGPGWDQLLTLALPLDWWWASCSMSCCARAGASLVAVTIVLVVLVVVCMEGCMAVREMEIAERDKEEVGRGNGGILGLASRWTRRTNIAMGGEGGWATLPAHRACGQGRGREVCMFGLSAETNDSRVESHISGMAGRAGLIWRLNYPITWPRLPYNSYSITL